MPWVISYSSLSRAYRHGLVGLCMHSFKARSRIHSIKWRCGASRIGFIPGAGRLSYYKVVIQPARERKGRALDGIGKLADQHKRRKSQQLPIGVRANNYRCVESLRMVRSRRQSTAIAPTTPIKMRQEFAPQQKRSEQR